MANLKDTYGKIVDSLSNLSKPKQDSSSSGPLNVDRVDNEEFLGKDTYSLSYNNWYTAKPYGFKAILRDGRHVVMFLPISPSNLTVSTQFATNVIATLYGTIEEHSEVRYYDIVIEGTTGMSPKFINPYIGGKDVEGGTAYPEVHESGRSTMTPVGTAMSSGGFFAKTLNMINQLKKKAVDINNGSNVSTKTGVHPEKTGYAAFHNLYRFLLQHKKDVMGSSGGSYGESRSPLIFFNYKDNTQYRVVVRGFTMRRSAENPMLYYYSIQLRGYDLKSVAGKNINDNLSTRFSALGLDGVQTSSMLGDIKSISQQAKSIVGSLVGGINIFGR